MDDWQCRTYKPAAEILLFKHNLNIYFHAGIVRITEVVFAFVLTTHIIPVE